MIAAEVAMVDLVVELYLPLSTLDKINKVVKKVFKDSDIAKNFQCARSKGTSIVKEISAKATLSLGERISRQPFTVSTDGSNDAGCHKLYPLVIKSVNPDTLEVSSEILSIPICEGSSTGENIFNLIEAEFKAFRGKIVLRLVQTTLLLWLGGIKGCMDICLEKILRSLWLVVFVTSFILLQKKELHACHLMSASYSLMLFII